MEAQKTLSRDTARTTNRFIIAGRLSGLNEYTKACRGNAYGANNLKKANQRIVRDAIQDAVRHGMLKKVNKYPCRLRIGWYEKNLKRDVDNVTFATKFILDAMVEAGIIENDSRKYVAEVTHWVFTDRQFPRIEVIIDEGREE